MIYRSFLLSVFLVWLVSLSCGEDRWAILETVQEWPICTPITPEERAELDRVINAYRAVASMPGYEWITLPPDDRLIIVRSMDDKIPEICGSENGFGCTKNCVDRWGQINQVTTTQPNSQAEGYGGWYGEGYLFVSRIGSHEPKLKGLLIHEYAHQWFEDGSQISAFCKLVNQAYKEQQEM